MSFPFKPRYLLIHIKKGFHRYNLLFSSVFLFLSKRCNSLRLFYFITFPFICQHFLIIFYFVQLVLFRKVVISELILIYHVFFHMSTLFLTFLLFCSVFYFPIIFIKSDSEIIAQPTCFALAFLPDVLVTSLLIR